MCSGRATFCVAVIMVSDFTITQPNILDSPQSIHSMSSYRMPRSRYMANDRSFLRINFTFCMLFIKFFVDTVYKSSFPLSGSYYLDRSCFYVGDRILTLCVCVSFALALPCQFVFPYRIVCISFSFWIIKAHITLHL